MIPTLGQSNRFFSDNAAMTLLLNSARANVRRRLAGFATRAHAPSYEIAPFALVGQPAGGEAADVWALTPERTVAMSTAATFA